MVAFSIIGILALLLIYFVLRFQNAQRDLVLVKGNARTSSKKAHNALKALLTVATEQQKDMLARLETANQKGLIKAKTYQHLISLYLHFPDIVMACSEKDASVEEAIKFVFRGKETSLQDIKDIVKDMPSDIRLSWSRNTVESFITVCAVISRSFMGRKESEANQTPEKENN